MQFEDVRRELLRQWTYTGGPNEAKAAELYHDDAVLEFPQSGERFVGKANIQGWRQRYPARLDFEPRELRGQGDLWVAEAGLRYDGGEPVHVVKILQFRGDKIERETLYSPTRSRPPSGAGRGPTATSPSAAATSRPRSTAEADRWPYLPRRRLAGRQTIQQSRHIVAGDGPYLIGVDAMVVMRQDRTEADDVGPGYGRIPCPTRLGHGSR